MFKKTFCSSPWIHTRILPNGAFQFCRWGEYHDEQPVEAKNIKNTSITEYFQKHMSNVRKDMLNGKAISACESCYVMLWRNTIKLVEDKNNC